MTRNIIWKIIPPPGSRFFIAIDAQIYLEFHPTQVAQVLEWSKQQTEYFVAMAGRIGDGTKHDPGYLIAMKQAGMKLPDDATVEGDDSHTKQGAMTEVPPKPTDAKLDPGYLIAMKQQEATRIAIGAKPIEKTEETTSGPVVTMTTEDGSIKPTVIGNVMETVDDSG